MKNIILIGMPGSGKTTVGKRIAETLNRDFIDTDEMIVKNVGKPIPDIFANGGEKLFRKYEHEAVLAAGNDTIENVANNILKELQNENTCN